jgi:hypothetical protein
MTVNKSFRVIDEEVMKNIPEGDDGFSMDKAGLYGVHEFADGGAIAIKESDDGDVYQPLANWESAVKLITYDGFGIVTTGWAAPIEKGKTGEEDDAVAPSQHPERTRVRLFVYCDSKGNISSSVRFKDGRDMQYDENQARGTLKDAMSRLFQDKKDATNAFKTYSKPI